MRDSGGRTPLVLAMEATMPRYSRCSHAPPIHDTQTARHSRSGEAWKQKIPINLLISAATDVDSAQISLPVR